MKKQKAGQQKGLVLLVAAVLLADSARELLGVMQPNVDEELLYGRAL